MRLWSIHPKYLDSKGMVAVWREGLLARKAIRGRTKGYSNHPQLERFRTNKSLVTIDSYLLGILDESIRRRYSFDKKKLGRKFSNRKIRVTNKQVQYEFDHLKEKLRKRDPGLYKKLRSIKNPEAHPIFTVIKGPVEKWERMK